ncbi:MAG: dihydrofolate reductase family protein [Spirochaetales bacterium]|nr:dihydrofolate reductase family protein [Spirochaetales bacterium]
MRHDLVDEYRLLVVPHLYGGGTRVFCDDRPGSRLKLIESRPMDTGSILLRYRRV